VWEDEAGVRNVECGERGQYRKGPHLNKIERFHIHAESIDNNHLNDDHTIFPNAIFDILLRSNRP